MSADKISKIILESGNAFHAKVARVFRARDWHVVVSPYYMDQNQSKAREIDLIVEKVWPLANGFRFKHHFIHVRLMVECKYVAGDAAFWFAQKDRQAAEDLVCRIGPFQRDNVYTGKHHYLSTCESVAKVFASGSGGKAEGDWVYKALNQSINATIAFRNRAPAHPKLQHQGSWRPSCVTITFPVVVCSTFEGFHRVEFYDDADPRPLLDPFQMEVQYAYRECDGSARDEYFLLDWIALDALDDFEAVLEADVRAAMVWSQV